MAIVEAADPIYKVKHVCDRGPRRRVNGEAIRPALFVEKVEEFKNFLNGVLDLV